MFPLMQQMHLVHKKWKCKRPLPCETGMVSEHNTHVWTCQGWDLVQPCGKWWKFLKILAQEKSVRFSHVKVGACLPVLLSLFTDKCTVTKSTISLWCVRPEQNLQWFIIRHNVLAMLQASNETNLLRPVTSSMAGLLIWGMTWQTVLKTSAELCVAALTAWIGMDWHLNCSVINVTGCCVVRKISEVLLCCIWLALAQRLALLAKNSRWHLVKAMAWKIVTWTTPTSCGDPWFSQNQLQNCHSFACLCQQLGDMLFLVF